MTDRAIASLNGRPGASATRFGGLHRRLPAPPRTLIGREIERAQILARLHDPFCRLVTITGPGGGGKTCLALDIAHALTPEADRATPFTAGVVFVPLAQVAADNTSVDQIVRLIADVLGLDRAAADPFPAQLAGAMRDYPRLLILDNCEHLPLLPVLIVELLLEAPELTVLATSRSRLGLHGEWVVDLDGLALPPAHMPAAAVDDTRYDAIRLFVERARAVAPDFTYTPVVAASVAEICRQVAGLPLGIELAASWTPVLTCAEIAREIAQNLDFLAADLHDLPARQQSLRALFNSSWELLTADEQRVARQFACFQGDFTREAAAAVAGASLPLLGALVKKSLVRRVVAADGEGARYALLGPLRPFAAEQLAAAGEAEATAARHMAHYLGWLANTASALGGPAQQMTLTAVAAERAEIRAAWRWAVAARDGTILSNAAEALFLFCTMGSRFQEGAELLLDAAEGLEPQAEALPLGRLLTRGGWCVFQLGRADEAHTLLERGIAMLRPLNSAAELVEPLNYLASLARHAGKHHEALAIAEEGLAYATAAGKDYGIVITATTLSQTYYALGRYAEARRYAEQSIVLERALGNRWGAVFNLITLGQIARAQGNHQEARGHFQEALTIRAQFSDARGMALCFNELGETAEALGEPAVAGWCYEQSLTLFRTIGNRWGEVAALRRLGHFAARHGQPAAAARLHYEALRYAHELGIAADQAAGKAALAELARTGVATTPPALNLHQAIAAVLAPLPVGQPTPAPSEPVPAASSGAIEAGLTVRELEVLRLVATGRTDAQVAEQLMLSTRTVSSYLSSIYSKLQVRSRSAATRWALEHGLA
jgi:predicted ATPase/DNA-binding CsgD family transcriptional regulator